MSAPAAPSSTPDGRPGAADLLLARQPIVDREARLRGYELLPRLPGGGSPEGDDARALALARILLEPEGLDVIGPHRAWVPISATLLLELDPFPVDPARVVLQVSSADARVPGLAERLAELRAARYAVAIDGLTPDVVEAGLLDVVSAVKLDIGALGLDGVARTAGRLGGRRLTVVAAGVESREEAGGVLAADCHLLQGWHVGAAEVVGTQRPPAATRAGLLGVAELSRPDVTFEDVERVVSADPALTVMLLRLLGSAAYAGRQPVKTVREALVRLGSERVRQWAALVLVGGVAGGDDSLMSTALARTHTMALLARDARLDVPTAETVGLLSVADRLLGVPRHAALADLPLVDEVREAFATGGGAYGSLLRIVLAAERGLVHDGDPIAVAEAQRVAFAWADERLAALKG